MPGNKVEISAIFTKIPAETPTPALPFTDVPADNWYCDAVQYVYARTLMTGTSPDTFSPASPMTRSMVWTVLARMSGADTGGGTPWYAKAQTWAVSAGVSDGAAPDGNITREQLAAMLYRQAGRRCGGPGQIRRQRAGFRLGPSCSAVGGVHRPLAGRRRTSEPRRSRQPRGGRRAPHALL